MKFFLLLLFTFSVQAATKIPTSMLSGEALVKTPGVTKAVVYSATISTAGVVSREFGDFISGNCTNADPSVCTLNSNVFSTDSYNCTVTNGNVANAFCNTTATTASSISLRCFDHANGIQTGNSEKRIICHGLAP